MKITLKKQSPILLKRLIILVIALWSMYIYAYSQAMDVTGKVTDTENKGPLIGANVVIKGTTIGTVTDAEGNFILSNVEKGNFLIFSYVGYIMQEIEVTGNTINVSLTTDSKVMREVVITAMGIKKEKNKLGYSVQEVQGNEIIKAREPNAMNSLVGKVSGLTVGASPEMLSRPQLVMRGSNISFFVVDGVPVNSDTWNINPDDIESFSVLKGPNAAAIYGFRGKEGAILITTKRGSKDKRGFAVEVNSSTMFDKGFNAIPEVQSEYGPGDHGVYAFADGRGSGLNDGDYDIWGPKFEGQLIPQYDSPVNTDSLYTTTFPNGAVFKSNRVPTPYIARGKDNLERFLQTGIQTNNNISISSRTEQYDLRFSVSNSYQRGIVPNTDLNSVNFNTSLGYNFSSKVRFESNLNYNRQFTENFPDVQYGPNSLIYNIIIWGGSDWDINDMRDYWQPGKEGVQSKYAEYQRYHNPYFMAYEWLRGHYKTDVYGYTLLRYKLNNNMEITGRTQVTTYDLMRNEKLPFSAHPYGREAGLGDYREDKRTLFENNSDVMIKADYNVLKNISIKTMIGANVRSFKYSSSFTTTDYLSVPELYSFTNSLNPVKAYNFDSKMQVYSGYYTVDISLMKYANIATTGRVDKLSTLPSKNNTYFYPSVSVSSVINDYVKLPGFINLLKIRGSYANVKDGLTSATIGTTPSATFPLGYGTQYYSSYDGPTYSNASVYNTPLLYNNQAAAYFTNTISSDDLKPSSNISYEAGIESKLFQNRFGFDVTYFTSENGPRIFALPVSEATGYTAALVNGIVTTKNGVEISVHGNPIRTSRGLNWDITTNWSTYRETLKEIYPGVEALNTFFKVGDRMDKIYERAFARTPSGEIINDESGRPIWLPISQHVGYANPDWVWSVINKFSFRNISLGFQFDGRMGGKIVNYIQRQTYRGGRHINTVEGAMGAARYQDYQGVKSWVGEGVVVSNGATITYDADGRIANYDQLQFAMNTTKTFLQDWISRYYQNGESNLMSRSFAKLREVTITFIVPSKLLDRTFIKQASVSLVGRNLLYFAEKTDIDIEQYAAGETNSGLQTPTMKRFGFNISVTF